MDIKQSRSYCTACPKMCHFSCPVAQVEKNKSYAPALKQQTAKMIAEKKIPLNADHALPAYKCLSCHSSQNYCDHEIIVADSLQEIREMAVKVHAAPPEVYLYEKKFKKFSNPYGIDLSAKLKKLPEEWLELTKPKVFLPSCHQQGVNPNSSQEYLNLFKKLKVQDLRFCSDTIQCCGYSLYQLGFRDEFEELANIQFNQLKEAEQVIVGSPECAWAMREIYPKIGLKWKIPVLSLFEYVEHLLQKTPYKTKLESADKFIYHDSCYMGRYQKIYDSPRHLLEILTGQEVGEFRCNRENSMCSGAGAGYSLHSPEPAREMAGGHIREMKEQGIKILVTACPQAQQHFRSLKEDIVVKDLISFLGEHLL